MFDNVNQTTFLFGALFLAFMFYITMRGDLPVWLGALGLGAGGAASGATSSTPSALPALQPLPLSQNPMTLNQQLGAFLPAGGST